MGFEDPASLVERPSPKAVHPDHSLNLHQGLGRFVAIRLPQ
jgi:hypothetical protein